MNKDSTNRQAKEDMEKATSLQPYSKNYMQIRNVESGGNNVPQRKAYKLVIQ